MSLTLPLGATGLRARATAVSRVSRRAGRGNQCVLSCMTATQVKGSRVSVAVGQFVGRRPTLHHRSPSNDIGPLELDVRC